MFSRFFIDRPIFAAVLSIFIVIAGLAAMRVLPIAQYPEIAPPVVTRARDLSRRIGHHTRADGRGAARKCDQRRRRPAVHELGVVEQRQRRDSGDLQHRRRRRSGGAERQQPRQAGRGSVAAGSAAAGRDGRERLVGVSAGAGVLRARRALRRSVHVQLRDAERARSAEASARHDQRADLRRQGLRDAHLAAAGSARAAEADHGRCRARDQRAELAVCGRQGRPGTLRRRPGAGVHDHDTGSAWPMSRSSKTSSCAAARMARRFACATLRASNWVRATTTSSAATTAGKRPWSASFYSPAPTRSRWRRASRQPSMDSPRASRTASSTRFRTTRRASSTCRFTRW